MGWSIGWDSNWNRDIGYGVPAICDHPKCRVRIDRGLSYVCGGEPYGGDAGCGLYFCMKHLYYNVNTNCDQTCWRCLHDKDPFIPKKDLASWTKHKKIHPSWAEWRKEQGK